MKTFFACIYKDICLFFSSAGVFALILPVLLALALMIGLNDTSDSDRSIKPFDVAVCDFDDTLMSRSLLSQLKKVELFSSVRVINGDEANSFFENAVAAKSENSDADALFLDPSLKNCAALITIPADFFYDVYDANEESITAYLNPKMPVENAIVSNLLSSVGGILKSERASWHAAYSMKSGGVFDEADSEAYYEDASRSIIDGALGRLQVFSANGDEGYLEERLSDAFFTTAVSSAFFLICIGIIKTLPDERRIGVADRLFSLGGKRLALLASKFVSALFLSFIVASALVLVLKPRLDAYGVIILFLAFSACFSMIAAIGELTRNTEQFMLISGVVTAAVLVIGGAVYPHSLMPDRVVRIGAYTVPACINNGAFLKLAPLASIYTLIATIAGCQIVCAAAETIKRMLSKRRQGRGKI